MNKLKMTIIGALAVAGAWCAQAANYLTFTAEEANSSVTCGWNGVGTLYYSTDGGLNWTKAAIGSAITLSKVGDKVLFKGANVKFGKLYDEHFAMTGKIVASGDVTSLTNESGGDVALTAQDDIQRYQYMFQGCTSLTTAPALPSTTLAQGCYQYMFQGCTSLTAAPALPATTLASSCYFSMFKDCTSLTAAPELPAATLQTACYKEMFKGCTSLTTVPELPAATLAGNCYMSMFRDCSNLVVNATAPGKEWKIVATPDAGVTSWGRYMFTGTGGDVSGQPDLNKTYYIASAPKEPCTDCITFSADKAFGMKLWKKGTPKLTPSLEYSTDQLNWTKVTVDTGYDAAPDGDTYKIHFRGTDNKTLAESAARYHVFTNTADSAATAIACSGNALTLLDYQTVAKGEEPTMENFALCGLFTGFAALTAAPALPATNLAENCYSLMFKNCTSLTAAPKLPATTLARSCYLGMFTSCAALTSSPELPATKLAEGCYNSMFQNCTSLTAAPKLPATTLTTRCYNSMFAGCTSLVVNAAAPGKEWKLAATPDTGVTIWGGSMFKGTGGDMADTPDLNTTYYVGAKKETVGDVTLWRYGDQVGVSAKGELTKEMADSIKDKGITSLVIGTGVTDVGANAFEGWWLLRDVTLGADCTNVAARAFKKCYGLTNVVALAKGESTVGDYAFAGCHSLQALDFGEDGKPAFGEGAYTFRTVLYMRDGIPEIYPVPALTMGNYDAVKQGTNTPEDNESWVEIDDETKKNYHFFRIVLEPKK